MEKTRIKTIFILGGPGSGKGTLCKKLKETFGFTHLSCGDILRKIIEKKEYKDWRKIKNIVDKGGFLPPDEMVGLIKKYYEEISNNIVLLDGFPRIKENEEEWYRQMDKISEVIALLYLECSEEKMIERILLRADERSDKKMDIIKKRIQHFYKDTIQIINEYSEKNLVFKINSEQNIEKVFEDTLLFFKNILKIIP